MLKTSTYKLKITLLTPMLGSQPTREIATEFIAGRAGIKLPEDEEKYLPDELERGTTVFHRVNDQPALLNYQVLGFIKAAGQVLNGKVGRGRKDGEGVKNLRSKLASAVFVQPRVIPLRLPEGGEIEYLERPLRASTAQGERVALARSEMVPEGTTLELHLEVLDGEISEDVLRDLLDYGYYRGLGQWRGSGAYGTFRYELERED